MSSTEKESPKKPYHPPKLIIYGDLRELTEASASGNPNADGGYGGILKTG